MNTGFPPYQYAEKFLLRSPGQPCRLLDSSERELLMGFGPGHTATCLSASEMKKSYTEYEDIRKSLVGDSFSVFSFALIGAVLCSELVPRMAPKQIIPAVRPCPRSQCTSRTPNTALTVAGLWWGW